MGNFNGKELTICLYQQILNRPYEIHAQTAPDTVHIYSESEVDDILRAVEGIVRLFKRKIYQLPSSIAVSAYKSLVKHLSNHYKKPAVLDSCFRIRYKVRIIFRISGKKEESVSFCLKNRYSSASSRFGRIPCITSGFLRKDVKS